ncbi:MAG: NAD-dependent protein deacetylase of SIR2 family [Deltaproteobacteria bacterium]|nr:NAD-dependent protein deacetylase of SIR2 family [Deltaproteobacteria bacterium]
MRRDVTSALESCADRLGSAERVLVGAGAGMSIDAGIDYSDRKAFRERFPAMVRRGFSAQVELIGYDEWTPEVKWGYLALALEQSLRRLGRAEVYERLGSLLAKVSSFVLTSNVDGLFARNGFDPERIFTPQGSSSLLQCMKPCTSETWPVGPVLDKLLPLIDPVTQEVTDSRAIPSCPRCGGDLFLNVRAGRWFVEAPYVGQSRRFREWVSEASRHDLLVLEIGAGFNTPGVVRGTCEAIVAGSPRAFFARVNPSDSQLPRSIRDRSVSIPLGARAFVDWMMESRVDS